MQEVSEAPLFEEITTGGLTDNMVAQATDNPNRVALRRRVGDQWQDVTSQQFLNEVRSLAKGLIAAGIQHGERIAIMSATRYEWTLADYAGWFVGATVVPIY